MVVKIVELIGCSNKSFEAAVTEAVDRASKTVRNVTGVDVLSFKASVENGQISEYRADVKVAFAVE